jgi:hypothetical protein
MACGVTADYVDSLFGQPPFRFSGLPDKVAGSPGVTLLTERIYETKHAWLQVIAGFDGSVRAFSITVTDPRFRFRSGHLMFDQLDIQLGAARFGDVDHPPDGWQSLTGARRSSYAESHYFGNPGSYQVYVLAYNDIGTGSYVTPPPFDVPDLLNPRHWTDGRLCPETGSQPNWDPLCGLEPLPAWLRRARDQTTVNTLTVLAPMGDVAIIQRWPGVAGETVRLLRRATETRRTRRLGRKVRKAVRRPIAPDPAAEPCDASVTPAHIASSTELAEDA